MNKHEYLSSLDKLLAGMPDQEKKEILYDYDEHFRMGIENGKSEEEIAASLGDVRVIAKQFKADFSINRASENTTTSNIFKAVLATVGLGFFNLVFVFGPFMGLVGVLIGLFGAAIGLAVGGAAGVFLALLAPAFPEYITMDINTVAAVFLSLGMASFGVLFLIADCYIAKYFFKGTLKYLRWNMDIIKK